MELLEIVNFFMNVYRSVNPVFKSEYLLGRVIGVKFWGGNFIDF